MTLKVLAIIPARKGSKRLPRKNVRLLNGKPLIYYTIHESINSKYVNRIVVSTDDDEVVSLAESYGVEVIRRPEHLARDDTPTIHVVLHVLDTLKEKENYIPYVVVLLQPTSPLRSSKNIDEAIELFLKRRDCLSLVSVTEYDHPPFWAMKIEDGFVTPLFDKSYLNTRSQDLPKVYKPNGAIFISTPLILYEYETFYTDKTLAYVMPAEASVDIDTEFDFILAECIIKTLQR